jgi:hypothetical protein
MAIQEDDSEAQYQGPNGIYCSNKTYSTVLYCTALSALVLLMGSQ